jgi:hypothetical protein
MKWEGSVASPKGLSSARIAGLGGIIAVMLAVIGLMSDATTLWGNSAVRRVLTIILPYAGVALAIALALVAFRESKRRQDIEAQLHSDQLIALGIWRRLVRVLSAGSSLTHVAEVETSRLQPLFDELAKLLPANFGAHHKFSVARPNADGSFTLLATRGMDPAAVAAIEAQASWHSGHSFYAVLLNHPARPEFSLFDISDSAYIDTRTARNAPTRASSSRSHFLIALRDDDIYQALPRNTLGIVSVGVPKSISFDISQQAEFYHRLLPAAKAIEALLVATSIADRSLSASDDP